MRARHIKNANDTIIASPFFIENPEKYKGLWHTVFNNNNPIFIEIGMGKGKFIYEMSQKYPDINFIGIERFDSIMLRSVQKFTDKSQKNIRLLKIDACILTDVFEKNEIDRIYLNFSDPWPKKGHAKRRLTNKIFLEKYQLILKEKGEIHFKTDNIHLFEYSLESMNNYPMLLKNISLDLHHSDFQDNIMTEYEEKFSKNGPIYRLEATFKEDNNETHNC